MSFESRAIIVTVVLGLCIVADLGTKTMIRQIPAESLPRYYLNDRLRLTHWENAGTLMGLGDQWPERPRFWAFTILASGTAIGLIAFALMRPLRLASVAALALIAGGSLSNVVDRVWHDGRALDFLTVLVAPLNWLIFNLADVAIALGALILAILATRRLLRC